MHATLRRIGLLIGLLLAATLRAQLVTPPTLDWVNVPASATVGQTVTVSAGAHANLSDNSDGNDWNETQAVVAVIKIELQRPGESTWTTLCDWLSPWQTPAQNSGSFTVNGSGTHTIRVQVMDGRPWYSDQATYSISVATPAPVINSALTRSAIVGQAMSAYTITATNSPTSYGATGLPAGLSLNTSTGVISGTPTTAGSYTSTISATNSGGTGSASLVWTIMGPPVINSALTRSAIQGQAISAYTITATNSPTSYGATGLPAGLSVSTSTGVITGTPTAVGSFNSTISATNSSGTGSATLVWTIAVPAPVITSSTGPVAVLGQVVAYTITATNSPTSYGATGLPAGLSLNPSTGVISGIPTVVGTYNSTLTASNAGGTGSAPVLWTISAPTVTVTPADTGTAVINGNVGMGTATPQAHLHVLGHLNREVARFQGSTDASNNRNFISLYSTNPSFWWEFSAQDANGNGMENGFALRAKHSTESISKPRIYVSPPAQLAGAATSRSFLRLYNQNPDYAWDLSIQDSVGNGAANGLALRELHAGSLGDARLYLQSGTGNIGIGTTSPTHTLAVNGTIRAKEVIVDTGWADYVFAEDYPLASLTEVEAHIRDRKHLPGIPSATEVAAAGVSLGDMQVKLLEKVEELTLHLIAQEKRIRRLEAENAALRAH